MEDFLYQFNNNPALRNVIYTVLSLVVAAILLKLSDRVFKKVKDLNPDDNGFEDMIPFLQNMAKVVIVLLLIFEILTIWGIDITPLLGAAGVAGIALAFAAQDSVANLFGGISIFFDRPFKVGDQILIQGDTGLQKGQVYKIGARSTKIHTLDNVLVTIPNSVMVTNPIFNETGYDPKMRVRLELGVAYGTDLEKVENLLKEILADNEYIINEPEPIVLFTAFGESAVQVLLIGTIESPQMLGLAKHSLIKTIDKRFEQESIEIPFPQRDVHLYKQNE